MNEEVEEEVQHHTEIWGRTHYPSQVRRVWVHCSCGYKGGPFHNRKEAEDDATEHVLGSI